MIFKHNNTACDFGHYVASLFNSLSVFDNKFKRWKLRFYHGTETLDWLLRQETYEQRCSVGLRRKAYLQLSRNSRRVLRLAGQYQERLQGNDMVR